MRYIARNLNILNLFLSLILASLIIYGLFPLMSVKITYRPRPLAPVSPAPPAKMAPPVPSPADYTLIAEENLFHPDRRIPPDKKEQKELPKPELVLYGTVIAGDLSLAYVKDKKSPYTTPGRGERLQVLKKGDVIGGFVLSQIEVTRITLKRNDEVMTVTLDTAKDRGGAAGKTPAAPPAAAQVPVPVQRSTLSPLAARGTPPPLPQVPRRVGGTTPPPPQGQ